MEHLFSKEELSKLNIILYDEYAYDIKVLLQPNLLLAEQKIDSSIKPSIVIPEQNLFLKINLSEEAIEEAIEEEIEEAIEEEIEEAIEEEIEELTLSEEEIIEDTSDKEINDIDEETNPHSDDASSSTKIPQLPQVSQPSSKRQTSSFPPLPQDFSPNWSDKFFNDDILLTLETPSISKTKMEINAIIKSLDLENNKNNKILDVACGNGRHLIALASRGYNDVTGIDLSVPFLLQASGAAQDFGVKVNFLKKDMRKYNPKEAFDAVYCIGGSFGYFDDPTNILVIKNMYSWLKSGGRLFLDVANRDFAASVLPSRIWWEGDGCMIMDESYFMYESSRVRIKRNVVFMNGKKLEPVIEVRAFTLQEISSIIEDIGFEVLSVSGSYATQGFFLGSLSPSILLELKKK